VKFAAQLESTHMRTSRAGFHRGIAPTFNCAVCGRRTRPVDSDTCCAECWELAGQDNYHNDNACGPTPKELAYYESLVAVAVAKGGDADAIRAQNPYIWANPDAPE